MRIRGTRPDERTGGIRGERRTAWLVSFYDIKRPRESKGIGRSAGAVNILERRFASCLAEQPYGAFEVIWTYELEQASRTTTTTTPANNIQNGRGQQRLGQGHGRSFDRGEPLVLRRAALYGGEDGRAVWHKSELKLTPQRGEMHGRCSGSAGNARATRREGSAQRAIRCASIEPELRRRGDDRGSRSGHHSGTT